MVRYNKRRADALQISQLRRRRNKKITLKSRAQQEWRKLKISSAAQLYENLFSALNFYHYKCSSDICLKNRRPAQAQYINYTRRIDNFLRVVVVFNATITNGNDDVTLDCQLIHTPDKALAYTWYAGFILETKLLKVI